MVTEAAATRVPLMQQRPFRMLTYSKLLSRVANNAANFALVLLVVDQTGRAFMSSLLVLTIVIPSTIAGLAAGVAADRYPKRLLVFTGDLFRAATCLLFAYLEPSLGWFFPTAFVLASATQMATSAEAAILPTIVRREELVAANAIGHAVTGIAQVLGYGALAPLALRVLDQPRLLFAICGGLFLVAGFYSLFIGRGREDATVREIGGECPDPWWLQGWRALQRDPRAMRAALELTLISMAMIVIAGLAPTYIEEVIGLPVELGAIALSPAALGVVAGLRLAGALARRLPPFVLSSVGFAGFVVFLLGMAFVDAEAEFLAGFGAFSWFGEVRVGRFDGGGVLAMLLAAPLGFCYALVAVAGQTTLNDLVPVSLQGRVFATQGALAAVAASVPVLGFGALADATNVVVVLALLAALIGAAAVVNLRYAGALARGARVAAVP